MASIRGLSRLLGAQWKIQPHQARRASALRWIFGSCFLSLLSTLLPRDTKLKRVWRKSVPSPCLTAEPSCGLAPWLQASGGRRRHAPSQPLSTLFSPSLPSRVKVAAVATSPPCW